MPSHPNIIKPADILVTSSCLVNHQETFVSGTSYPVMKNGSLDQKIDESERADIRLSLQDKARWCRQRASAIHHAHLVAHTYDMDVKLGNFLLDDQYDLILIDWEQSGAPPSTLASEANGEWDVKEIVESAVAEDAEGSGPPQIKLVYTKYEVHTEKICGAGLNGTSFLSGEVNVQELWRPQRSSVSVEPFGCCCTKSHPRP
jgi:hypothetical protein